MALKAIIFAALVAASSAQRPYLGFSSPLIDTRVVGGDEAQPGQFPWQVSLQWNGGAGAQHFCGGSIISSDWILTAGHCINAVPPFGEFAVLAGKHNLKAKESQEQKVIVAKSIVHEKYAGNVNPYDIALVKLRKPLKFNKAVAPISLPKANSLPLGILVLSGWGSISTTSYPIYPDKLQTVKLPVVDLGTCKRAIEQLTGPSPLHETNVCTGPLSGGYSACSGDSGGPLVDTKAKPELVGVVSWGIVPCGIRGAPSVYTRVSAFVDWIQKTMAKN